MASLKDLKVGDHVLMSREVDMRTTYDEQAVSDVLDSGIIIVNGDKFDPITGLECDPKYYRRNIALMCDEQALSIMRKTKRIWKIQHLLDRLRECEYCDLTYDQAVEIAKIMGWEV